MGIDAIMAGKSAMHDRRSGSSLTRRIAVLLVAVVAVLAIATLSRRSPSPDAATRQLTERVEDGEEPAAFAFDYSYAGSRVTECFVPNRRFSAVVDYEADVLSIRLPNGDSPIAITREDTSFIHRSLLAPGAVPSEWLRVAADDDELRDRVARAIGSDMARYLFARALPATARTTALDVLEVTMEVEELGQAQLLDGGAEGFRLRLDPDAYAAVATTVTSEADAESEPTPTVEIWLRENEVVRVAVSAEAGDADADTEAEPGWIIDYRGGGATVGTRVPTDAVGAEAVAPGDLARPVASCSLPAG